MRKFIFSALALILGILGIIGIRHHNSQSSPSPSPRETPPVVVKTASASDLATIPLTQQFPGVVASEGEATLVALVSGTVSSVPFTIGNTISQGSILVRIDDPIAGTPSKIGIRSDAIRQAELDLSAAKKRYAEAKKTQEKQGSLANRLARDTAKLDVERAEISLRSILNDHIVRSPITGIITEMSVRAGDTVSSGDTLAKVARSKSLIIRFSVPADIHKKIKLKDTVSISSKNGNDQSAVISAKGAVADAITGNFIIEATPIDQDRESSLVSGTLVSVGLTFPLATTDSDHIILPLQAITTSQNGSLFYREEDGVARETPARILSVSGSHAIVSTSLSPDSAVIVEASGALQEGAKVTH